MPHDRPEPSETEGVSTTTVATRRRIGEILVELGIVSDDDVARALDLQRSTGKKLGDVLLSEGLVQPRDLVRALAAQFELEFVDLSEHQLDLELAQQIPPQLARHHRALPVWRRDGKIVVAMANPVDVLALDDIRDALRRPVIPVMADVEQIMGAINRLGLSDLRVQEAIQAAVGETEPAPTADAPVLGAPSGEERAPIVAFVDLLLSKAIQERASDIHIEPGKGDLRIRFRVDGVLHEAMSPPRSLQAGIISRIKVMADIDIAERRLAQDGRMTTTVGSTNVDIRVATIPTIHGEAAVLRILRNSNESISLDGMGFLPEQLDRFRSAFLRPWGAILVTGPTGSGKSTTLYGALEALKDPSRNIITAEDPVEYKIDGIKQVQINNKAGMTFARALRSFLRADPDIMLVGEIRDGETATIAVEASLTGHLVLSTLHTNNAASAPMRLIEMGVEPFLVTSALTAVVAQRLARRLCDRCKQPRQVLVDELGPHGFDDVELETNEKGEIGVFTNVGCEACGHTGYRGRFAIHEVLTLTDPIRHAILSRASAEEVHRLAIAEGMISLRADGLRKVRAGLTTLEELFRVTT